MTELDNSGFVKKGDPHPTDYKDLSSHVWALADNQRMPGTLEYTCLRCGIPYFDIEGGETVTEDSCPPPPRPRALGSRDNSSKPPISMVLEARHALEDVARVLEFGAKKYSRSNWKNGLPVTEIIDSMLRHQLAYLNGEQLDQESGLPHTAHIACNSLFLAEMYHRPEMDDRPNRSEIQPSTIRTDTIGDAGR